MKMLFRPTIQTLWRTANYRKTTNIFRVISGKKYSNDSKELGKVTHTGQVLHHSMHIIIKIERKIDVLNLITIFKHVSRYSNQTIIEMFASEMLHDMSTKIGVRRKSKFTCLCSKKSVAFISCVIFRC